ncbi:Non-specific serine/threonine protein kinase [Mycena sanguinolenta]|uniref:non-specific serine/threonine protein kinase n=1 Tax=Mycena sanguinolenta TaxID=230812 RepID=A0A8H6YM33_9AGAR|nr:Non-specific serine/threonine protein kinase [Mycena sanguinolenta]
MSSDEHSSSPLCSLSVEFRFKIHIGAPRFRSRRARRRQEPKAPPPYSETRDIDPGTGKNQEKNSSGKSAVVRQGRVRVKDRSRNRGFNINWLVLTDTHLTLHPYESKPPEIIIPLSDITKLERTETESYSLILETRANRIYLLAFRSDDDIYDWKDAISYRITGISNPWNFKHNVHVGRDSANGEYSGLSAEWAKLLLSSPEPPTDEPLMNTSQLPSAFRHGKPFAPIFQTIELSERILLRVNLETWTDLGHYSLGLSVLPDTPMPEVLAEVRRRTNLEKLDCGLALLADGNLTPLDMKTFVTVADLMHLQDTHHLVLLTPENGFSEQ